MTPPLALLRLLQTADSAFPSGGFAFSNGLETLVREGAVRDGADVERMLIGHVVPRWLELDRYFVAAAHAGAGDGAALAALDRACEAQSSVPALAEASRRIGRALLSSHARIATPGAGAHLARLGAAAVPGHAAVAQGLIGAGLGLERGATEAWALHALLTGWTGAAIRLGRLGALGAQEILARAIAAAAPHLAAPPPAVPAGFAPLIDIAAMRRDGQGISLFAT